MDSDFTKIEFRVDNLGSVQIGYFTHKPLTIFCGPNNTGKTWTLYSLYHFYRSLELGKIDKKIYRMNMGDFNDVISSELPRFFNASPRQFRNSMFGFADDHGNVADLVNGLKNRKTFLIPAERNGLHLLFRELSSRRTTLLHNVSQENVDIVGLLKDVINSRYARPIAHYIDWLNDLTEMQKSKSADGRPYATRIKRNLAAGSYKVDPRNGAIEFRPYRTQRVGVSPGYIGLHIASSTVKSLFSLWFYLEHQAHIGDILMIDEPELNIHPDNQRQIARLLASLVNAGINIVISTHSDYIIREFNSLIMLSQDKGGHLRRRHGYNNREVLQPDQVGAYLFDQQTITEFEITPSDGIYATTFDEVITDLNKVNDDIYYSLRENNDG